MIIRYRCDHEMATKKGIRQICDKRCRYCLCAIRMNDHGVEAHVPDMAEGSSNFTIRNTIKMSGRDRAGKRGRPISHKGGEL